MRITRIDVEGEEGRYATMTRKRGTSCIEVTVLTPENPNGRVHCVEADSEEDIASMADCLHHELREGMRTEYHQALRHLAC